MQFENLVILHRYGDGVKCRVFLTTLSKTPNNGSAALEVPTISQEVKINTLTNGLRDEDFFSSLAKKPVETFDDWLMRDKKYITLEEVRKAKKAETKPSVTEKKKAPKVKLIPREENVKVDILSKLRSSTDLVEQRKITLVVAEKESTGPLIVAIEEGDDWRKEILDVLAQAPASPES
ncbi:hypothetical protein ACS0TY_018185 [Phlomoides rotata]